MLLPLPHNCVDLVWNLSGSLRLETRSVASQWSLKTWYVCNKRTGAYKSILLISREALKARKLAERGLTPVQSALLSTSPLELYAYPTDFSPHPGREVERPAAAQLLKITGAALSELQPREDLQLKLVIYLQENTRHHKSPAMQLRAGNGQGDHTIRLFPTTQRIFYFLEGSLLWDFYRLLVPAHVFAACC